MKLSELVRQAVHEVMSAHGAQAPPLVRVLARRDRDLAADVLERLGGRARLVFLDEDTDGQVPARHILPSLCCGDMADLALGRASGPVLTETLRLLLAGKTVEVLEFEYRRHAHSAPEALMQLYRNYEAALASYGLMLFGPERAQGAQGAQENPRLCRLVTERTVKTAAGAGIPALRLAPGAIVTALAADAAKALGVHLLKQ